MNSGYIDLASLSSDQYIAICELMNGIEDYIKRVHCYYNYTGRFPDPDSTFVYCIVIDEIKHTVNVLPKNKQEGYKLAMLYYDLFHKDEIEKNVKEFYERYDNCGTIAERDKFLQSEAKRIQFHIGDKNFNISSAWPGYEAIERKLSRPHFASDFEGLITIRQVKDCIWGMVLCTIELTIQEESRKLEILKELKPNLDGYKNGCDPYVIEYNGENSILVQGQKFYFPFDCYGITTLLGELRVEIIKPTVSSVTLQKFPDLIFDKDKFTGHYPLAEFIYNIIETWVREYQITYHYNTKKQLLEEFLSICEKHALAFNNLIDNKEVKDISKIETVESASVRNVNINSNHKTNLQIENSNDIKDTNYFTSELKKIGFFELKKVINLSLIKREALIELIFSNEVPYQIAMLDYLDFFNILSNIFPNKNKLYKHFGTFFQIASRTIKGNINVLNSKSTENKKKYTSHLHKEQVVKDYETLK